MIPTFSDEQHAARWLAKFALPFVNATPEHLRKTAFNVYAQNIGKKQPCRCDGTDDVVKDFDYEGYDTYKRVTDKKLADLQKLIKTMLYIALSGKYYEELPKDIKRQVEGIEETIKTVFTRVKCCYEWKGKGRASVLREGRKGDGVISRLEEWFIQTITDCLYSISLAPACHEIEPMKGEGFDKIGMCPVCNAFFEKKRKDQDFCSDKCSAAARMRRLRSKK